MKKLQNNITKVVITHHGTLKPLSRQNFYNSQEKLKDLSKVSSIFVGPLLGKGHKNSSKSYINKIKLGTRLLAWPTNIQGLMFDTWPTSTLRNITYALTSLTRSGRRPCFSDAGGFYITLFTFPVSFPLTKSWKLDESFGRFYLIFLVNYEDY